MIALCPVIAGAYPITSYLEMVKVSSVSNSWKSLTLDNSYSNPVVACTYNLTSGANAEGSVRVQVLGSTILVRVQRPLNGAVSASDVYCTVSEAGSYTSPIKYEAYTIDSTQTNSNGNWGIPKTINVTGSKVQNYTNPVVTGQVMSFNDPNFVTFWSSACNKNNPATNAAICVGKHTGESDITTEYTETLGYFIAEQAEYTLANAHVKIALGADTVRGAVTPTPAPPYNYTLPRSYSYATATLSAMDGGDGGWAVLYGSNPISTSISLAIDEDTVRNTERNHTTEQVAYWVMEPIQHPELSLKKTIATIYDPINLTSNPKSIPGAVLEYTLLGENSGDGPADNNSIVLTDLVPANTKLCVADIANCKAPYFTNGAQNSGLSLASTTYSNDNGATYTFTATPDAEGANTLVTNFKTAMSGSFLPQTGATAPSFTVKFRVILD
ncbi:DUF11 domain-containing protein [Cocleimonas flava]|uniref:DUF11 domain-containing protein n=1 Tax=Cocleimonas flava TaxID=634765 RepID=UPI00104B3C61|nr:DUF11 domain-containing protein [Cocleimonas flava]